MSRRNCDPMALLVKTHTVSRLDIGPGHARHQSYYTQEDKDSQKNRSIKKCQNCRLLQTSNRVSRNACSQEKLGFCDGGLAVVVEGDEAAVTFSPFIRSLRGAQCAESSAGPGPGNKSSCPQELQLGNNTTKLLHPGSASHLSRVLGSDF